MSALTHARRLSNLRLAWERVRSNPERKYKDYFREQYSAYALADEDHLKELRRRLVRGSYLPDRACKVFAPKPSGILRPFTLLTIEDQVVYQAFANVVGEALHPHVRHRYNKQVFGHMFAGPSNRWFYKKWSDGYAAFNSAARQAFNDGYRWTASFDLTAFYDSIDHHVLRQMLKGIGLDHEFCQTLTDLLESWTATSTQIVHHHGIPQGPISSGMISESVLKYFDDNQTAASDVRYFRYVDDIRLFARKEQHLRKALVKLDRLSKDIGLFPQSGKIDIHEVVHIEDELKILSSPDDDHFEFPDLSDQQEIRRAIRDLTPGNKGYAVVHPTRFKFLVSRAHPSLALADRLWRVYEKAPHFYPQLASHLKKFNQLHARHAKRLLDAIEAQELYPAIQSEFIDALTGRIPSALASKAKFRLKRLWKPNQNQPDLTFSLWRCLHEFRHFTPAQRSYALSRAESTWLRGRLHFGVTWADLPRSEAEHLLNHSLRFGGADAAMSAAWICGILNVPIHKPISGIQHRAKVVLREMGLLRRAGGAECGVRASIRMMTGVDVPVNWRKFFGKDYKSAEAQIITCRSYFKTNATAWVNATDGFIDWLLQSLYKRDPTLGAYQLGNVGGVMNSAKLKAAYPEVAKLLKLVHEKRYVSNLSHAVTKGTMKPTGAVPFRWLVTGARQMRKAVTELQASGY